MTRSLTTAERDVLVDRIAARIAEFDDAALVELDRVTDEATYLTPTAPPATADAPPDAPLDAPLSRRQLIAGGAILTLASLGTALAVRGAWPPIGCP